MTALNQSNDDAVSVSSAAHSVKESSVVSSDSQKPALQALPEEVRAALIALTQLEALSPKQETEDLNLAQDESEEKDKDEENNSKSDEKDTDEENNSNAESPEETISQDTHIANVIKFVETNFPNCIADLGFSNDTSPAAESVQDLFKYGAKEAASTLTSYFGRNEFDIDGILPPRAEYRNTITEFFGKVGSFFLQSGHFILNNREYAALGFISFIALPLFNFASMGMLAYVAYPVLVLAAMQVLYFNSSSSVMRDGVKLNTKYVSNILDLSELKYEAPVTSSLEIDPADDNELSDGEISDSSAAKAEGDEEAELLSKSNETETEAEDTYWNAFTSFNLVKLFSNLHPSVMSDKWKDAGSEDKTWTSLLINSSKIALLYTGVYFGAGLVTPFVINPLHTVLALGGSASLVGSYFAALGVGYLFSKATNQSIAPENTAWYQGSGIVTLVAVASLLALSIVFMPQAWLASVLAAPAAVAFIAPSIIALGALGAYTTNAVNAKLAANNAENEEEVSVHNQLDTEGADNASVSSKSVDRLEVENTTKPETSTTIVKQTQARVKMLQTAEKAANEVESGLDTLGGNDNGAEVSAF